jgi:hypothetical protein
MTIEKKKKILESAKARYEECEREVKEMEKAIDEADLPFRMKISEIEKERRTIIDPMHFTLRSKSKTRDDAQRIFNEAQLAYDTAAAEGKVPANWKEFNEWWGKVGRHTIKAQSGWRMAWEEQVKAPKIDGVVVFAGKSDSYNEKIYCAWETGGRFIGAMVVEPSQHIGDTTNTTVFIDGKEVGENFGHDTKKPLKRFIEAVKWAVAKNAPIWRAAGEKLPVGAIVKVETYCGHGIYREVVYGVVTMVDKQGIWYAHENNLYTEMVEEYDPDASSGTLGSRYKMFVQVDAHGTIITIKMARAVM